MHRSENRLHLNNIRVVNVRRTWLQQRFWGHGIIGRNYATAIPFSSDSHWGVSSNLYFPRNSRSNILRKKVPDDRLFGLSRNLSQYPPSSASI
jgi:hypothetical protein